MSSHSEKMRVSLPQKVKCIKYDFYVHFRTCMRTYIHFIYNGNEIFLECSPTQLVISYVINLNRQR
jgi:tRNA(Ile2) C34 agmatinyltransferase TiaS